MERSVSPASGSCSPVSGYLRPTRHMISFTGSRTSSRAAARIEVASVHVLASLPQECEELDSLAQSAPEHVGAARHLAYEGGDLRCAEVEAAIEFVDRMENLGMGKVRVVQG